MHYRRVIFSILPLILLISSHRASAQESIDLITNQCLQVASQRECSLFIRCCDHKCQNQIGSTSRQHFCMSLLGQIITEKTECVCNSASTTYKTAHPSSKYGIPRMDLVAGIMLIFVLDFLLLTFTL